MAQRVGGENVPGPSQEQRGVDADSPPEPSEKPRGAYVDSPPGLIMVTGHPTSDDATTAAAGGAAAVAVAGNAAENDDDDDIRQQGGQEREEEEGEVEVEVDDEETETEDEDCWWGEDDCRWVQTKTATSNLERGEGKEDDGADDAILKEEEGEVVDKPETPKMQQQVAAYRRKRWPIGTKIAVIQAAIRNQVYRKIDDQKQDLPNRWATCLGECRVALLDQMRQTRSDTQIKSQIAHLMREKRAFYKKRALLQSEIPRPQLTGEAAVLDIEIEILLDNIAAENAKMVKPLSGEKRSAAAEVAKVHEALNGGFANCRPGANATPPPAPSRSCDGPTGAGACGHIDGWTTTSHSRLRARSTPTLLLRPAGDEANGGSGGSGNSSTSGSGGGGGGGGDGSGGSGDGSGGSGECDLANCQPGVNETLLPAPSRSCIGPASTGACRDMDGTNVISHSRLHTRPTPTIRFRPAGDEASRSSGGSGKISTSGGGGGGSSSGSGGGSTGGCEGSGDKEDDEALEPFRPPGFIPECLKTKAVPPLGEVWPEVMHHNKCFDYDSDIIRDSCHASAEEMNLFETTGWKNGELDPVMAVALMTAVVYTMGQMFPGGEYGGGWDGNRSHGALHTGKKWEDVYFVGLKTNPLRALCRHYGARPKTLKGVTTSAAYKLYTQTGWHGDQLSPHVVDFLSQRTAVILLSGRDYRPPTDDMPGSDFRPFAGEMPGSDYRPPAGEMPESEYRPTANKVPGSNYLPLAGEVGLPGSHYRPPIGQVELPGSDCRPPAGEGPRSDYCLRAGEAPGSDYCPPVGEVEMPRSDYRARVDGGTGSDYRPSADEVEMPGSIYRLPTGEVPRSDYFPRAGKTPGRDYCLRAGEAPGSDYCRLVGEVEIPGSGYRARADEGTGSHYRPSAGEVEMPGSAYRPPTGEVPRSDYFPHAGEIHGSDYCLRAGKAPGSVCSPFVGEVEVPGSDYRARADEETGSDDRPPAGEGSDDRPPAGEVPRSEYRPRGDEVPGSDYRTPVGEVEVCGSDYRPPVAEVEVPGSAYRPPVGEVEVPGSDYRPHAGEVEVPGSGYLTPADEIEVDRSGDDNGGSKKRKIKTERCSRSSVQKLGDGSLTSRSSVMSASSATRKLKEESRDEREDAQRRFEAQEAARKAEREDDRSEREAARKERMEMAKATFAESKRKDKIAAAERRRKDDIAVKRGERLHEVKMLQLQLDLVNAAGRASWSQQEEEHRREKKMPAKVVLLGCAQDAGVPQVGCACQRCDSARSNPGDKDSMVACLGIVDENEGKVFLVDATPDLGAQLWSIQHAERKDADARPLQLGGILLTHAHTGHYTGLLQLGKEGADARNVPVFCTPKMASFLRNNEPWAQLTERGNISIRELQTAGASRGSGSGSGSGSGGSDGGLASVRLTPSVSFLPVFVPHRAELSDTVAYVISMSGSSEDDAGGAASPRTAPRIGGGAPAKKVMYCPDTDGWTGWTRSIRDWCEEVDVALLDATFYSRTELKDRDMSEVSHPLAQDTMKELAGCKAEVVLVHLNHTNPLFVVDSPERTQAETAGFKVGTFGMEWTPTVSPQEA